MGNTKMPAVMLNGPNMICFVAKRFADMRQTQNSIPKSIKDTLTVFPFICFLFFKRLPSTHRTPSSGMRVQRYDKSRKRARKSGKRIAFIEF